THFLYRYTAQSYMCFVYLFTFVLFFNATPSTEIYTLSLHDALPISFLPGSSSKFQSYWPVDHSLTCSGLTGRAERLAFTKRRDHGPHHERGGQTSGGFPGHSVTRTKQDPIHLDKDGAAGPRGSPPA